MGDMIRYKRIYYDVINAYIYNKVCKRKKERSELLSFFRLYTLFYIYTYNIIIYPLISYHIPHFTKTFTAIYLE